MHRCLKLSHPAFETPAWIETRIWDEVAKQLATDWRERSQYRQPRAWRDWQKTGTKKLSRTWTQHSFICFATRGRRGVVGAGATGWLGIIASVEAARRHPEEMKALVLMSGRAFRDGLQFLHQAAQLPQLFVFSSEDEYSPTEDAMKLLYPASSPGKKLVHYYSATEDGPLLCYETSTQQMFPVTVAMELICLRCTPNCPESSCNGQKDLALKYAEKGLAMLILMRHFVILVRHGAAAKGDSRQFRGRTQAAR